jgi:hypothetical protein
MCEMRFKKHPYIRCSLVWIVIAGALAIWSGNQAHSAAVREDE